MHKHTSFYKVAREQKIASRNWSHLKFPQPRNTTLLHKFDLGNHTNIRIHAHITPTHTSPTWKVQGPSCKELRNRPRNFP